MRGQGVCRINGFATMFGYTSSPLIWYMYATWPHSEKRKKVLTFWPDPLDQVCMLGQNICACMVFYAPFPLMICNMTTLIKHVWPVDQISGIEGVCKNRYVLACCSMLHPFNWICNMTIFRKKYYDSLNQPKEPRVCVRTEYVITLCSMLKSI